jgi:hypothetical protein
VPAVDAVAREPLATMQALVERMSQPHDAAGAPDAAGASETPASDGTQTAPAPANTPGHGVPSGVTSGLPPGLAAALSQAAALAPGLVSTLESTLPPALQTAATQAMATAQAQQGRMTLGQMAQQSQVTQVQAESALLPTAASALNSAAAQQALAAPQAGSAQGTAPSSAATLLNVPVWMAPLQTPAGAQTQRHAAVQPEPAHQHQRQQPGSGEEGDDGRAPGHGADGQGDAQSDAPSGSQSDAQAAAQNKAQNDAHTIDSRAIGQALLETVRQHGSAEVQRELQAGRRVLVVLPHDEAGRGLVAAQAALLGPFGVRFFESARWWPGDALAAGAESDANANASALWPQWRVFREGDPLRAPVLVSRADGHVCRVLLGTPAPQVLDSHTATLELPERLRFVQALGGQWSLLLVVAPAPTHPQASARAQARAQSRPQSQSQSQSQSGASA